MASEEEIKGQAQPDMRWYVVRVEVGYEKRVSKSLARMIEDRDLGDYFGRIMVPTEEVIEVRDGQRRRAQRRFFPGYVLVEMRMKGEVQLFVRQASHVLGFIGGKRGEPAPLSQKEIDLIIHNVESGADKPKPKVAFEAGDSVRIIDGPFVDFDGVVESVNDEKQRLRVSVLIFGRATPVELEFGQVEKV